MSVVVRERRHRRQAETGRLERHNASRSIADAIKLDLALTIAPQTGVPVLSGFRDYAIPAVFCFKKIAVAQLDTVGRAKIDKIPATLLAQHSQNK